LSETPSFYMKLYFAKVNKFTDQINQHLWFVCEKFAISTRWNSKDNKVDASSECAVHS